MLYIIYGTSQRSEAGIRRTTQTEPDRSAAHGLGVGEAGGGFREIGSASVLPCPTGCFVGIERNGGEEITRMERDRLPRQRQTIPDQAFDRSKSDG